MAYYKISEILDCLQDMKRDGFEYVEISELEPEEEFLSALCLDAVEDSNSSEGEQIDSVTLPDGYVCRH